MNYRPLGNTGLNVSVLGFGCGAVGGLMVRGDRTEMVRAVAHAIDQGVTYFDTAPLYGDGQSETNLGLVLRAVGADVIVGTKVRPAADEFSSLGQAIVRSVEASLRRLQRETIDLIQLHNAVAEPRQPARGWVSVADVEAAVRACEKLQTEGKVRHWGFTGLGKTPALHRALATGVQTVQTCFNLLNPSAGTRVPAGYPFQDFGQLIDAAAARQMGVIAIRVLAGGALSGSIARHVHAAQNVAPIASGAALADDVAAAQRFRFLIDEGYVGSLVEAAIRFVVGKPEVSTLLVGYSSVQQLEDALAFTHAGPLPAAAQERLDGAWATLAEST